MKTSDTPFFQCNQRGEDLFSVRSGVSIQDALSCASDLLDTVSGLLNGDESHASYGALVLVRMAKAAIDSVEISESVEGV